SPRRRRTASSASPTSRARRSTRWTPAPVNGAGRSTSARPPPPVPWSRTTRCTPATSAGSSPPSTPPPGRCAGSPSSKAGSMRARSWRAAPSTSRAAPTPTAACTPWTRGTAAGSGDSGWTRASRRAPPSRTGSSTQAARTAICTPSTPAAVRALRPSHGAENLVKTLTETLGENGRAMSVSRPGDPRQVGPYRIVGRLGAGGMCQVLLGRSPSGRMVAVKVIHPAMAEDGDFRARFRREITAARAVGGVYTAPVVDADPDASPPWLATTFLRGMSLQDAVAAHGPLPPPAVRALGAALAEALRSVHGAGIVHRDLKPSNVMLTPEGPRVIDFGIARPSEATTLTRTGATLGTPAYMSPEQASGQPAGPPSDVFSLRAVLTYAATGVGPFGQGAVHELVYRVIHLPPYLDGVPDPGLRALIAACMEKDPARRPTPERLLEHLSAEPAPAPQGTHWLPPPV